MRLLASGYIGHLRLAENGIFQHVPHLTLGFVRFRCQRSRKLGLPRWSFSALAVLGAEVGQLIDFRGAYVMKSIFFLGRG